jgi:hypothetical protein
VSHRIFPNVFINDENIKSMSLVGFSVIIHGTMNSIIFLAINIEVLDCFLEPENERSEKRRDLLGCSESSETFYMNFGPENFS